MRFFARTLVTRPSRPRRNSRGHPLAGHHGWFYGPWGLIHVEDPKGGSAQEAVCQLLSWFPLPGGHYPRPACLLARTTLFSSLPGGTAYGGAVGWCSSRSGTVLRVRKPLICIDLPCCFAIVAIATRLGLVTAGIPRPGEPLPRPCVGAAPAHGAFLCKFFLRCRWTLRRTFQVRRSRRESPRGRFVRVLYELFGDSTNDAVRVPQAPF